MHILHIHSEKDVAKINKHIEDGCHVFILVYMEGCGPCNATRPEWEKLDSALSKQYAKNNNIVVIDVNKDFLPNIKHIGSIDGFPTMKYIGNHGSNVETYEDSPIKTKDRSVSSFINWIETKATPVSSRTPTSSANHVYKRLIKNRNKRRNKTNKKSKKQYGGKWSRTYKRSINCSRPKGFSQKQYCKYGRKI